MKSEFLIIEFFSVLLCDHVIVAILSILISIEKERKKRMPANFLRRFKVPFGGTVTVNFDTFETLFVLV